MADEFTPAERGALAPYFSNLDGPVFALVNLPEVVKGALFARYSRSPKALRRLFLEEFAGELGAGGDGGAAGRPPARGLARAEELYARVYRLTIRAKALDTLRGLLPAATTSNVGIYGSGQAWEQLLLRMRAHPLAEVRWYADEMLRELRTVIPAFLRRVDVPARGGAWSAYLGETRGAARATAGRLLAGVRPEARAAPRVSPR